MYCTFVSILNISIMSPHICLYIILKSKLSKYRE